MTAVSHALRVPSFMGCSFGNGGVIPPLADAVRGSWDCPQCQAVAQVLACVRAVYVTFGMDSDETSEASLRKEFQDLHFELKADPVGFFAYLKYKTAAAFADYLGCEMPKKPERESVLCGTTSSNGVMVGGRYYAFYQKMKRERSQRSAEFFYSLLMLKKGFPRPTEDMLVAAALEARRTMTTEDARPFSRMLTISAVAEKARRIVQAIYRRHEWSDTTLSFPSTSAHYGWSREDGGALGAIREKMGIAGRCFKHAGELVPLINGVDEAIEDETRSPLGLSAASVAELRAMQDWLVDEALQEPSFCEPVCLPEPLKIRTVTKGPALRYLALAAVQKVVWSQLAQDRRFQIASPMDGRKVLELLGRLEPGKKWLSGDYKAATDNLAIELSYEIAQAIADRTGMDDRYRRLFVDGLVGHVYDMGVGEDGKHQGFRAQARGQLMGSPVSFPVLCIANAAVIWESLAPEGRFEDLKMIINGDDCLFQCTEEQRLAWCQVAADVGLSPSVGKTYFHDRWAVINSALFDTSRVLYERRHFEVPGVGWAEDDPLMEYRESPYLNMGLLLGLKRSGGQAKADGDPVEWRRADRDGDTSLGARARDLVKGWTTGRTELMELFMECNRVLLDGDFGRPYHVPAELGGWGLPLMPGQSVDCQDMLATIARIRRGYDTQVRVKETFTKSEYCLAVAELQRSYPRVARRTGFSLGKFQMSSVWPEKWAGRPFLLHNERLAKERDCPEGWHGGYRHRQVSNGCSGCTERRLDKQVRRLAPFWNRMRTVGQSMALSRELDVLTEDGEDIDDRKVADLYWHSLSCCLVQETPAYDVMSDAWGVDGSGHVFGDSSFPNWGAHPPPHVVDVWALDPAPAIELGHVLA